MADTSTLVGLQRARKDARAAFMAATKGEHPHTVARALNSLTPGTDWRGCSRGLMAEQWADATQCWGPPWHPGLARVALYQLAATIKKINAGN